LGKFISIAEFPIILTSGIVGQKVAAKVWTKAFGDAPPDTAQEDVRWAVLIPAAIVEGIFYKLFRVAVERSLRVGIARSTGTWVGGAGEGE
jgi:class 3 adenylate cyclase